MAFKCVLLTGGCGAIGSEVINRLKSKHPNTLYVNYDALTYAGKEENIEKPYDNYVFVHGDITDSKHVYETLEKYKPDAIFHLAAETHVDNSFGNSFRFTHTNVYGTHVLLECCKQYIEMGNDFKMFLHMSTDEVYGSVPDSEPARIEESIFKPSNPYAASKAGAEMICHAYQCSFKIPIIIVRCNNAISKYQHEEKLIPRVIACIMNNKRIPIHGLGTSKRTFIHAYDIADALDIISHRGKIGQVYNIGSDLEYSVMEVVAYILKYLRPDANLMDWVEFVPDRLFQDYRYSIDTSALMELGWRRQISTFEQAVSQVIDFKRSEE
jgi:dTDP-glucose 4,6-dehydratase